MPRSKNKSVREKGDKGRAKKGNFLARPMASPDAQPGERVRLDNLPVPNVATKASCGSKYCIPDALVPFQGKSWVARFEALFNTGAGG